jgi:hypothetical protein
MTVMGSVAVSGAAVPDERARSILEHGSAVRIPARVGVPAKNAELALAPAGLAILRGKTTDAYTWSEVRRIDVRRGAVVVSTEAERDRIVKTKDRTEVKPYTEKRRHAVRVCVDGVDEPALAVMLARVLEDMRTTKFSFRGTSWIEYQNALDQLRSTFHDQDDAVLPAAAVGLWLAVGLMLMFLVPVSLNGASLRAIPSGAFAISDPLGAFDPRSVIAGFALSALIATTVLKFALGPSAAVWARGAARGWARQSSGSAVRFALRQMGRMLQAPSSAAVIFLLAVLAFWPNIAATVLVDQSRVRNEVLLPFISIDEPWQRVADITKETDGNVSIHFADGRMATTVGHELGGGTKGQYFDRVNSWWKAAR